MAICDSCGNDYDKAFKVMKDGKTFTFDSFECAIHRLAPSCAKCGVRIVGHGLSTTVPSTAVTTAPSTKASRSCVIVPEGRADRLFEVVIDKSGRIKAEQR